MTNLVTIEKIKLQPYDNVYNELNETRQRIQKKYMIGYK